MNQAYRHALCALVLTAGLSVAGRAAAGTLDSPAGPENALSAMWTLNDLYHVLDTRETNVTKRTGAFTEPGGGPTNGTMHTLNEIMTLVTNRAPVAKTGSTTSYQPGDDGHYKAGVAWPNPRFTAGIGVDGTNCVTDNLTGLMWTRNVNIGGSMYWSDAIVYCETLDYGGHTDWRLPTIRELQSLVDYSRYSPALCNTAGTGQWVENDPFTGVSILEGGYWASTVVADNPNEEAWIFDLIRGGSGTGTPRDSYYVWPVRGGR
jgi:hypothetical protein